MCTLAALLAPDRPHPVLIATNRDERVDRPARPFGRHWPGRPWRAGLDELAGGTWAGVHDDGFAVFLLNAERSLGPAPGKRSRGALATDLLATGSLDAARRHAEGLDAAAYRPFHAILASAAGVVGVTGDGERIEVADVLDPLSIWTASGRNTDASGRQRVHRPAFEVVSDHHRVGGDAPGLLDELGAILGRGAPDGHPASDALTIRMPEHRFATRSSLLLAFPAGGEPVMVRVAEGPPDETPYVDATETR